MRSLTAGFVLVRSSLRPLVRTRRVDLPNQSRSTHTRFRSIRERPQTPVVVTRSRALHSRLATKRVSGLKPLEWLAHRFTFGPHAVASATVTRFSQAKRHVPRRVLRLAETDDARCFDSTTASPNFDASTLVSVRWRRGRKTCAFRRNHRRERFTTLVAAKVGPKIFQSLRL